MPLSGLKIDQICNSIVSIEFLLRLSHTILLEPSAIVILIKQDNPRWHKIHLVHFSNLSPFLLPLIQCLIRCQDVNVLFYLGLLNGEKILQNVVYPLTEENRIVLFVIVQNSQKPTHVVLVHRLVLNLFTCTRHPQ